MKRNTLFILLLLPLVGLSQSYVFCPDIDINPRKDFGCNEISIVFKDNRIFEKKLKEKCEKHEIFSAFIGYLKQTYPSLIINQLDEANFYEEPDRGRVLLQIELTAYEATFYPGVYIAKTNFHVNAIDFRNEKMVMDLDFSGEGKQFNALGNVSGKIASNSSFQRAFDNFLVATENFLLQNRSQETGGTTSSASKTEKLRELKALLDEGVLTQSEFEAEKSKVLAH